MATVIKALIYTLFGSFYVMLSYYILPPIIDSFVGSSAIASIIYIALMITWIVAVIAVPTYTLYRVMIEGSLLSSIITFIFGILILFFGYWLIPNFINSVPWEGVNGIMAEGILWTGWTLFVLGSVIFMPIYQIMANKKENRWLGNGSE